LSAVCIAGAPGGVSDVVQERKIELLMVVPSVCVDGKEGVEISRHEIGIVLFIQRL